ncbi:MAG: cytochrome c biogenesis protein ResB, partial [Campylobacteraceae bacterium]|nr:cytochrome c biogenesis protein ResB [Campylobacteraceae bacterium]
MGALVKQILSIKSAIVLLVMFGIFSGVATFVENDFGAETSWAAIYTSWWFELIQILLGIVLLNNIIKYKMYKLEKLPSFLFHVGFIFILIGSGVTRYIGFEGSLHVRDGQKENRVMSSDPFIQVSALKDDKRYAYDYKKFISNLGGNAFNFSMDVAGEKATITFKEFIPSATKKVMDDVDGKPLISMMVSGYGETENITLREGEIYETSEYSFTFNAKPKSTDKIEVAFTLENGKFFIYSAEKLSWFKMVENKKGEYEPKLKQDFVSGQLYTIGSVNFAPKYIGLKGKEKVIQDKNPMNKAQSNKAVVVNVAFKGEQKEVVMFGQGKGNKGLVTQEVIAGVPFKFEWGSKVFVIPFFIKLHEFQLDRYAGSMSPMSYASEVEVVDEEKSFTMPFRIYMNHVLDYRGFRFFQTSYDMDEKGTILSVNNDPGKWPTYFGYLLLGIGLFFNLINPKSRFRKLAHMVQNDASKIKSALIAGLLIFGMSQASPLHAYTTEDFLNFLKQYDKKHADKFGEILVQSVDGRIKPIDTISAELLNKVYGSASYKDLTANQVALGMMSSPIEWQTQPIIKVFHPELKKIIGLNEDQKYASFNDFFEKEGSHDFKLTKYSEEANRKKPALRNQFDKDVLKVDERVNICYMVYMGEVFKMIPKQNDVAKKWYA